jgi:hypothetical protein
MHPVKLLFQFNKNRFKLPRLWVSCPGAIDEVLEQDGAQEISFDLPTGVHKITLQLLNKENNDTILENNKIVDDLYVIVKDIIINNINFTKELNKISLYTGPDGNILQTQGWISFGSPFEITVQAPGFLFRRNIATLDDVKQLGELYE